MADDHLLVGTVYRGVNLNFGSWIVEDYDYEDEVIFYRAATTDERKLYDLR